MTSPSSTAQLCQQVLCLTTLGTKKQAKEVYFQRHQNTQASLRIYCISSISSDETNGQIFRIGTVRYAEGL